MGSEKQVVKQQIPNCQEKVLLSEKIPVPKPTQVGKERILRRAEEPLLRNSAKCPRNFGRRGAIAIWPQKPGPSDCLPKTQVSAKSQDEV